MIYQTLASNNCYNIGIMIFREVEFCLAFSSDPTLTPMYWLQWHQTLPLQAHQYLGRNNPPSRTATLFAEQEKVE